jgi:phosphate starvation-inducible PhoH-like protein
MVALLGQRDELLKLVEAAFDSEIVVRGNEITIAGPEVEVERVALLFEELITLLERGHELNASSVGRSIELIKGEEATPTQVLGDVFLTGRGRGVAPKTLGQKRYVDAMRSGIVTFAIGPAGTGKTYLAVATAVRALEQKQVSRLILTRPAVEAGERLGYLPGTLLEKVDPYLRPLFDALYDMLDADRLASYMEKGIVEVAPLAFMRGRTLNDSFVILDEAQNTSPEQMQMFLTRLGFGSKVVVTGDVTQVDLPREQASGLIQVQDILGSLDGIAFVRFGNEDVVRHKLVQRIVEAYRKHAEETGTQRRK